MRTHFSRYRQPFKCIDCGKVTTGPEDSDDVRLCRPCYEYAGWENAHSDDGHERLPDPVRDCPVCREVAK